MITITGWSWEYIDEFMTFPRLRELDGYWERHPPVHQLVAAYMGYKAPETKIEYGGLADLISAFQGAGGQVTRG